ncbi:plant UBX domain-containing protein 7 [Iris pallida]|uniref:Plant UBX domain-containing protein 7 n=2 Tax=Iris pallida TaxID=29817 RepID=A0AAX6HH80_IRIPA|nr:plant UBX domain-containing protein 7 [Iris pallida]
MESSAPSASEKQGLISSFLEIAAGQSADTALQFLQATNWKLEEAIQLFYLGNEAGGSTSSSILPPVDERPMESVAANENVGEVGNDEVRAPLPVKRETLYGDASFVRLQPSSVIAFRNFEEESKQPAVWESEQSDASTMNGNGPRDNLASLYRPPFALMYQGTFDKAKVEASLSGKWLLVNLQSTEEFSSHMLNRDTWSNDALAQTIRTNFIFWQVYQDSTEGKKVCTYYKLTSIPAVLIIDPVTGQKMRGWSGMVQPERLLEDLLPFLDKGPKEHHVALPLKRRRDITQDSSPSATGEPDKMIEEDEDVLLAVAASMEGIKCPVTPAAIDEAKMDKDAETSSDEKLEYPLLPEEPKASKELLCRVGIRLPDGRRVQRNFLCTDSIKLLWSFCCSLLDEGKTRPFHFTQAIPGASKSLKYTANLTFGEARLSNSMVSLAWD